jgi:3,4-dihydroxy-2-butanone 4-phosphate synthase
LTDRFPPTLRRAIDALARGDVVALLDRADREAEADLILAAEHATGERVNRMITIARGILTLAISGERLTELEIPLVPPHHPAPHAPRFAVPVDVAEGITTGVSAYDRAATIRALADPSSRAEDFTCPGHVFPLAASPGGLAERQGHTEGALALAELAGLRPVVAMCEIMAPDGLMARGAALRRWLVEHGVAPASVPQIVRVRGLTPARS